jgi:DNA-directed RNA polymerase subunit RPC12/RpoP
MQMSELAAELGTEDGNFNALIAEARRLQSQERAEPAPVRTLVCRQCQWKGEPEETTATDDGKDIECQQCGSSMLIELPDEERAEPAPDLDTELRRWQDAIREKLAKAAECDIGDLDGSGSDSGDP